MRFEEVILMMKVDTSQRDEMGNQIEAAAPVMHCIGKWVEWTTQEQQIDNTRRDNRKERKLMIRGNDINVEKYVDYVATSDYKLFKVKTVTNAGRWSILNLQAYERGQLQRNIAYFSTNAVEQLFLLSFELDGLEIDEFEQGIRISSKDRYSFFESFDDDVNQMIIVNGNYKEALEYLSQLQPESMLYIDKREVDEPTTKLFVEHIDPESQLITYRPNHVLNGTNMELFFPFSEMRAL